MLLELFSEVAIEHLHNLDLLLFNFLSPRQLHDASTLFCTLLGDLQRAAVRGPDLGLAE